MASDDRKLKLKGYAVFRFGGYELTIDSEEENFTNFSNL